MRTNQKRKELLLETDKIIDDLYYFKDMLSVGESRLSRAVTENLLRILIFPILLPLLQLGQSNVRCSSSYLLHLYSYLLHKKQ